MDRFLKSGGLSLFVELLRHANSEMVERAVQGVGNTAVESTALRDELIAAGAVDNLIFLINQQE
jgi:hypothetical protein